jgi:hypothetical protein
MTEIEAEKNYCACGCGKEIGKDAKFSKGHNRRGIKVEVSEETREKQRQAHLGKPATRTGIAHTEESKQKISESVKRTLGLPEQREKNRQAQLKSYASSDRAIKDSERRFAESGKDREEMLNFLICMV